MRALLQEYALLEGTPTTVMALKRVIHQAEKGAALKELKRQGWKKTREVPNSGAWWAEKGDLSVLITFGGPRKTASVFSYRKGKGTNIPL